LTFAPADGSAPTVLPIYEFKGKGVAMAMYNTDESIYGFAHASFKMALSKKMPLFMSTKKLAIISEKRDRQLTLQHHFEEVRRTIQGHLPRGLRIVSCGLSLS
jgi:isocitrate dehydrogenase